MTDASDTQAGTVIGMEAAITYRTGDATTPVERPAVIAHICNDAGGWGAGFVVALGSRYPAAEMAYRRWAHTRMWRDVSFRLGAVQFVDVGAGLTVANMIAQHGYGRDPAGRPAIRYRALSDCLSTVADVASRRGATVVMPPIGTGLAGGRWGRIVPIITSNVTSNGVAVVVYRL